MPHNLGSRRGRTLPILLVVGVVCVLVGLLFSMKRGGGSSLEPFPVSGYSESPKDFLGNSYELKAQVESQLGWEKSLGRILAVTPEGSNLRLPVFVPDQVGGNLHKGQRFEMSVLVEEGGLIYVEALRKY